MAKTNADRQKAYRKRAKHKNIARLNLWVDLSASLALARLARHEGVTKRQMIERLVLQADEAVYEGMELDTPEWAEYSGVAQAGHVLK